MTAPRTSSSPASIGGSAAACATSARIAIIGARRRADGDALLLDAHDPLDPHARAGRGGVRAAPRILDGEAQRLALGRRSILQIEPHAADRRGARRHRLFDELAELGSSSTRTSTLLRAT